MIINIVYKILFLINAIKNGWKIFIEDSNTFFIIKKKEENEIFSLKNDINQLVQIMK